MYSKATVVVVFEKVIQIYHIKRSIVRYKLSALSTFSKLRMHIQKRRTQEKILVDCLRSIKSNVSEEELLHIADGYTRFDIFAHSYNYLSSLENPTPSQLHYLKCLSRQWGSYCRTNQSMAQLYESCSQLITVPLSIWFKPNYTPELASLILKNLVNN